MNSKSYFRPLHIVLFFVLSTRAFSQPDSTFHIYLMFGQSNMEGQGTIEAQDRVTNPRVKMLQDSTCPNLNREYGVWYTAAPPLNRCWGKLGPGDSFGRMLGAKAPSYVSTIGLVNVSVSGCNIFIYKKGCPDGLDQYSQGIPFNCGYTWLLDLAKRAQQVGVIKGIIFHQGETNNTDPAWKYTVQQIIADMKSDLGLGDIPFLAGELLYAQYNSCCSAHNTEINKLPGIIPNAHVISSAGLPGADEAHFTSASYRTLGERYAQKMLQLVYDICDSTTIESWYQVDGDTALKSNNIVVSRGTSLVLSPHPTNLLGTWNWTGAGTSGASREQNLNFSTEGRYTATATYTNECGTISRLPVNISVCDSTLIESWYQRGGGTWQQSSEINVLKGSNLLLGPRAPDSTGAWSWQGAGLSGTSPVQTMITKYLGLYMVVATYTNHCGAKTRLPIKVRVCDSTKIESWYQVDGGSLIKADSFSVNQNAVLILSPAPATGTGTWEWAGTITSGYSREQTVNTAIPGAFTATAIYTNWCSIPSHMTVEILINPVTGYLQLVDGSGFMLVYPNPANNTLIIKSQRESESLKIGKAVITNMLGQIVLTFSFMPSTSDCSVDIGHLGAGTYYLKLDSDKGIFIEKFVKIK